MSNVTTAFDGGLQPYQRKLWAGFDRGKPGSERTTVFATPMRFCGFEGDLVFDEVFTDEQWALACPALEKGSDAS